MKWKKTRVVYLGAIISHNFIPLVLWLTGMGPSANSSSSGFESPGQHSLRRSLQKTLSLNSLLNFSWKNIYLQFKAGNWFKEFGQRFSLFFAIFGEFSKWSVPKAPWNFEKSIIMPKIWPKIEEKHYSTLAKTHFSAESQSVISWIWKNWNIL